MCILGHHTHMCLLNVPIQNHGLYHGVGLYFVSVIMSTLLGRRCVRFWNIDVGICPFSHTRIGEVRHWRQTRNPGVRLRLRVLCSTLALFHTDLGTPYFDGQSCVPKGAAMLEQVWVKPCSSGEGKWQCYEGVQRRPRSLWAASVVETVGRLIYGCDVQESTYFWLQKQHKFEITQH